MCGGVGLVEAVSGQYALVAMGGMYGEDPSRLNPWPFDVKTGPQTLLSVLVNIFSKCLRIYLRNITENYGTAGFC